MPKMKSHRGAASCQKNVNEIIVSKEENFNG